MNYTQFVESIIVGDFYQLGDPWRLGEKGLTVLVPIRGGIGRALKRDYILPSEGKENIVIKDSGNINGAQIENKGSQPVFFRAGTVLKGNGTQSRAVVKGTVVQPTKKTEKVVDVLCVHASRGISRGSAFFAMDELAPSEVYTALSEGNQSAVWKSVNRYSSRMQARASGTRHEGGAPQWTVHAQYTQSDNLSAVLENKETTSFAQMVMDALSKVPDYEDQVGVAIIDLKGVRGIEAFDHPDSWKALGKEVLKSYEDIFSEAGEMAELFQINLEAAKDMVKAFLRRALSAPQPVKYEDQTYNVGFANIQGEYTILNGGLIHLILTKRTAERDEEPSFSDVSLASLDAPVFTRWQSRLRTTSHKQDNTPRWTTPPLQSEPGKGFFMALGRLKEKDRTFNDLVMSTRVSRATVAARLKDFTEEGLAEKYEGDDGHMTWRLTAKGRERLRVSATA